MICMCVNSQYFKSQDCMLKHLKMYLLKTPTPFGKNNLHKRRKVNFSQSSNKYNNLKQNYKMKTCPYGMIHDIRKYFPINACYSQLVRFNTN